MCEDHGKKNAVDRTETVSNPCCSLEPYYLDSLSFLIQVFGRLVRPLPNGEKNFSVFTVVWGICSVKDVRMDTMVSAFRTRANCRIPTRPRDRRI
jgi:hypothetical protein